MNFSKSPAGNGFSRSPKWCSNINVFRWVGLPWTVRRPGYRHRRSRGFVRTHGRGGCRERGARAYSSLLLGGQEVADGEQGRVGIAPLLEDLGGALVAVH